MVGALYFGGSGPGSSLGQRHNDVFLGKTLCIHCASLQPGVRRGTRVPGGNPVMDQYPTQGEVEILLVASYYSNQISSALMSHLACILSSSILKLGTQSLPCSPLTFLFEQRQDFHMISNRCSMSDSCQGNSEVHSCIIVLPCKIQSQLLNNSNITQHVWQGMNTGNPVVETFPMHSLYDLQCLAMFVN